MGSSLTATVGTTLKLSARLELDDGSAIDEDVSLVGGNMQRAPGAKIGGLGLNGSGKSSLVSQALVELVGEHLGHEPPAAEEEGDDAQPRLELEPDPARLAALFRRALVA